MNHININITPELKEKCPNLSLGCIACDVQYNEEPTELWASIHQTIEQEQTRLAQLQSINQSPNIANARIAYKKLGKDPSRYRLSAEALLRRVVKGKGIYQINNVVDTLNLVSIKTAYSIGGYDLDKIEGAITFGIGQAQEPYEAIGRGTFNIENLPTFRDEKSAFGTPTSDSVRTMVTPDIQRFLMIIIDFDQQISLEKTMEDAVILLQKFAGASGVETWVI